MKRFIPVLLGVFGFAMRAPAEVEVHKDHAAVIYAPITGGNLDPINQFVLESIGKRDYLDLIINSPGGSVSEGWALLNRLDYARSKGVTVNCFVPEIAASMAFQILLHCDHRYALKRSGLLWHRVSVHTGIGASINSLVAADLLRDLLAVDKQLIQDLVSHVPMTKEAVLFHLDKETMHLATDLNEAAPGFFEEVPDNISGLYEALTSPKVVRQTEEMDILRRLFGGEIIYIKRGSIREAEPVPVKK
jgi:ATP-dependent protease ClpP protease subunit